MFSHLPGARSPLYRCFVLFQWPKLSASLILIGSAALAHLAPPARSLPPKACARAVAPEPVTPEPAIQARPVATPVAVPLSEALRPETDRLLAKAREHMLAGENGAARDLLERCVALDAQHAGCHRALGALYASTGRPRGALAHYRRYVELAPDASDARAIRAIVERAERLMRAKF